MNIIDATTGEMFMLPELELPSEQDLEEDETVTCGDVHGSEAVCEHLVQGEQ